MQRASPLLQEHTSSHDPHLRTRPDNDVTSIVCLCCLVVRSLSAPLLSARSLISVRVSKNFGCGDTKTLSPPFPQFSTTLNTKPALLQEEFTPNRRTTQSLRVVRCSSGAFVTGWVSVSPRASQTTCKHRVSDCSSDEQAYRGTPVARRVFITCRCLVTAATQGPSCRLTAERFQCSAVESKGYTLLQLV